MDRVYLVIFYVLMVQAIKNPHAMQETWVWCLVWKDPLEKGMATHSSILASRIPWTEEPGGLQTLGLQRVGHDWVVNTFVFIFSLFHQCRGVLLFLFFFYYHYHFIFFICSEFCHTLKWNSDGFTCVPHPDPTSHLPLHLLPLGLPSAPGPSTCLMHPTWAGDLFHPR